MSENLLLLAAEIGVNFFTTVSVMTEIPVTLNIAFPDCVKRRVTGVALSK